MKVLLIKSLLRFVLLLLLGLPFQAFCQNSLPQVVVKYIQEPIQLDGALEEAVWKEAGAASEFWQFFPSDTAKANQDTQVKLAFDDNFLYVGIYAESTSGKYVVSSLKRDFSGITNDNVTLLFDTFNDGTTAYYFGVTPYGVMREGLISDGGTNFNNTWDIKWQAQVQQFEDHFTIEIAIPLFSLKFMDGATKWRFRPFRANLQETEHTTWLRIPQNQPLISLAYMGEMVFERPLKRIRTPYVLIPYLNTFAGKDFLTGETDSYLNLGGDAKIAVGNGMNLDLTFNPDFSNVEVDDILTNLTRFELILPEKRQFFIDNNDLFANYGSIRDNIPFFSRRIGIAKDKDGNTIQNPILIGARLSGKLNSNTRLGVLNIQTREDPVNEIGAFNNAMVAVQRKVFSRSNLGVFMVNRQATQNYEFLPESRRFNRVIGIDYDLASPDNVWRGNFYVHKSFQPGDHKGNLSAQSILFYDSRKWRFATDLVYVDQDFRADLGFVPRKDMFKYGNSITRRFYPKSGKISNHSLSALGIFIYKPTQNLMKSDHFFRYNWEANFTNQSTLSISYRNNYIYLFQDFDPTRTPGSQPIPGEIGYKFNQADFNFNSNPSSLFNYVLSASVGEFFNGNQYSAGGILGYRFQPWVNLSMGINYDGIRFPEPYNSADIWLVTPKIEVTFSRSVFWNTLIQFSNQRQELGINSRLQWRFAPMSDLFLVYNDNYLTNDQFSPRFRSINLKLTYWLNL
jgi:hypothetical protein